jgi:hypothetical protein
MIIAELNEGRPLPYRGSGEGGGHAFLLDGFQTTTTTYFHINWGWGGHYDGWFLLSALNPEEGYDYTDQQAAVFNIQPNDDNITRYAYTGFEGYHEGWIYDGGDFYPENGSYDMVRSGELSYGFDNVGQWLISPKIHIPDNDNATLSIWGKMLNSGRRCDVYLSLSDTSRSAFNIHLGTIAPSNTNWSEYAYTLRPYKNTPAYLGFHYDQSAGYIALDDVSIYTPKVQTKTDPVLPVTFSVLTIYPNPFNPRTTIGYTLSAGGEVMLDIVDCSGRQVAALPGGYREAGDHRTEWYAGDRPSGIYLCMLRVDGELQAAQKLLLVK